MKKIEEVKKRGSTLILRLAVFAIGAIVLALCIFALPEMWRDIGDQNEFHDIAYAFRAILIGLYIAAVPFFYALYQALKLLDYIDKNKAFSRLSVTALKRIAYCGVAISLVFVALEPFLYVWAEYDDAPGLIVFGMIIIGAALSVSMFAAVMQRLLREAIEMKSENDLTV